MPTAETETLTEQSRQDAVVFINSLAEARDLDAFVVEDADDSATIVLYISRCSSSAIDVGLLQTLLKAVAHGTHLFVAEQQQLCCNISKRHQWAITLLGVLSSWLTTTLGERSDLSESCQQQLKIRLSVLVASSGRNSPAY